MKTFARFHTTLLLEQKGFFWVILKTCCYENCEALVKVKYSHYYCDICLPRYESHLALPLGLKKGAKLTDAEEAVLNKKRSKNAEKKYKERQKDAKVEQGLTDQFMTGE